MRLAPTEKLAASLVMTKASKLSPGPPGFSVCVIRLRMSPPREFILEWNSMQATPSPRSMREAPEFFFTTPRDFLATAADQTPLAASTAFRAPELRSKYALPEAALASSAYQEVFPAANSFSTFA